MDTYTLTFQNNSEQSGDICIFQESPDLNTSDVLSLAWFAKHAKSNNQLEFSWNIDYSFVWNCHGEITSGSTFRTPQMASKNSISDNTVPLLEKNSVYQLKSHTIKKADNSSLHITSNNSVSSSEPPVGIAMSGSSAFLLKPKPNTNIHLAPPKKYWISFGKFKQGQIIDRSKVTHLKEIVFPPNVNNLSIKLNSDKTWSVE